MANCNELFGHFNNAIKLDENRRTVLREVRNSLRNRMESRFTGLPQNEIGNHRLAFESQGSYVMDTIIIPKDDDFDLDDGVYFMGLLTEQQRPSPETFHKWVMACIGENEDYAKVIDKDTCVRVQYAKEKFHIDLPIYYRSNANSSDLAHTKSGWLLSSPLEFIEWFEKKIGSGFRREYLLETRLLSEFQSWKQEIRKEDVQLRRIVRYLKAWGDELRGEMPPGIIMTILAADNYLGNERDDIALRDTLIKTKETLTKNGCICLRPTTPKGDDLFANYSQTSKNYFLERLETFANSANQAIANPNQKEACLKWQRHLGNRFPCSLAKDEIDNTNQYNRPAIIGSTAKSA